MKYKIMVVVRAGYDDTMEGEYNGVEYTNKREAEHALKAVKRECKKSNILLDAYLEESEE